MIHDDTGGTDLQAAAATFVVQLNRYSGSVGTFAVQSDAVLPAKPEPKIISGPWGLVVGLLAGLVAGCGAVGLVVVLRHPVVGAAAAAGTSGLPVTDVVVVGPEGVRVAPPERPRGHSPFEFMSSDVSSEKPKALLLNEVAERIRSSRTRGASHRVVRECS